MEREDVREKRVAHPGNAAVPPARALRFLGRAAPALAGLLALGFAGAAGCQDTLDSAPPAAGTSSPEPLGAAQQGLKTGTVCAVVRAGATIHGMPANVEDAMLSSEKPDENFGLSAFGIVTGGALPSELLLKFDVSFVPSNATVLSAGITLNQTNAGAATINVHRALAPWSEATVTRSSFGGGFDLPVFKTFTNAAATITFDVKPQAQGWVNGSIDNQGVYLESASAFKTTFKTSQHGVATTRPTLNLCFEVTCAPGTADCNGDAFDGCEVNTNTPANCGACGNVCAAPPNAAAACPAGVCALGACNLGFGDCDGNAGNGCETPLSTSTNCGACGVVCALPNATESCATGTCSLVSCNPGSFNCDGNAANGCEATPCANGSHCGTNGDCASHVCQLGFCASPACNDQTTNGTETDVDCGGTCPPCASGLGCVGAADCQSGVCVGGVCAAPTCADQVKNGSETAVDCGGGSCPPCPASQGCSVGTDCQSGVCLGGICQPPSCGDGLKNGAETGVDCGGLCAPCPDGSGCAAGADCASGVCAGGVCQLASCADGVKNGSETDIDCGGSCPPCNANAGCVTSADCGSGVCVGGHCQPPSCTDGVKNGDETGVDCGGACTVPETCNGVDDDCNGSVDEGLGSTTCGVGACQRMVDNCVGGMPQVCVPGQPVAENCDGELDEDCDGVVDNGCSCVNGSTQPCYSGSAGTLNVGVCHGGTQTCVLGHFGACIGEVTPTAEACNGLDDDCDGQTDEDLGTTICGTGACQVMSQNCVNGAPHACTPGSPSPEICDGLDNDCNGSVDEGLGTLSCGVGPCQNTVPACVGGAANHCSPKPDGTACDDGRTCTSGDACHAGSCSGNVSAAGTPCRASSGACDPAELCNGVALDCPADQRSPAGTPCRAAVDLCDVPELCDGTSAACPADQLAVAGKPCRVSAGICDVAESCTGASAACPADGFVAAGTSCRGSAGVCDVAEACTGASALCPADAFAPSSTACTTGQPGICAAGTCAGNANVCNRTSNPSPESCNSLDDNCNGAVDEGNPGGGGACSTGLQGVCSAGSFQCLAGHLSCIQSTGASADICDGLDNDCNGSLDNALDEGFSSSCGGAATTIVYPGATSNLVGIIAPGSGASDFFAVHFQNVPASGGFYHPNIQLTSGGGDYILNVQSAGCGGSLCGNITRWEQLYPSDPNACVGNGNCVDFTPRGIDVVVQVLRIGGASVNSHYTVSISNCNGACAGNGNNGLGEGLSTTCGAATTTGVAAGSVTDIRGRIPQSGGSEFFAFQYTSTGSSGSYFHPKIQMISGANEYIMNVQTAGCGGSLCGNIGTWEQLFPSDPNACVGNGNCFDATARQLTGIVQVLRIAPGATCNNYVIRVSNL